MAINMYVMYMYNQLVLGHMPRKAWAATFLYIYGNKFCHLYKIRIVFWFHIIVFRKYTQNAWAATFIYIYGNKWFRISPLLILVSYFVI